MFRAAKNYLMDLRTRRPRATLFGAGAGLAVAVFGFPLVARAGEIANYFLGLVAELFKFMTEGVAYLLFLEVRGLLVFAQYSNFVNPGPKAVEVGWIVTRDLANMFFILILLLIAFGTILGREEYAYKKRLPSLLIMAVVINFSKTICGLLIDFGQVVMLTFVNGFIQAAGGNFLRAFQIDKMLDLDSTSPSASKLALGMMLAFILVTVAAAVVLVMMVILAWRIIVLWLLIIMSPIAFLANATGKTGEGYYKKWWDKFRNQIIVGPMLAFFLWLTLIVVQASGGNIATADGFDKITTSSDSELTQRSSGFPTEAGRTDVYLSFVIATCLLMAGLQLAIETSDGLAKDFAGAVSGGLRKAAGYLPKKAAGYAAAGAKKVGSKSVDLAKSPFKAGGKRMGEFLGRTVGSRMANSRSSLIAGLGRKAALGAEGLRSERLKKKMGTTKMADFARLSKGQFLKMAAGATPEEAGEFAETLRNNPALMAEAQKTGAFKNIQEGLRKKAKPDKDGNFTDIAGANKYYDFMKAGWKGASSDAERKEIFKRMSGDEAKQLVTAGDINPSLLDSMNKDQITSLMKGTPQQREAMVKTMNDMEMSKSGQLAAMFRQKGINPSQFPPEVMDVTVPVTTAGEAWEGNNLVQTATTVQGVPTSFQGAMYNAAKMDSSFASKIADNPKMAGAMGGMALAESGKLLEAAKARKLNDAEKQRLRSSVSLALTTGAMDSGTVSDFGPELVENIDMSSLLQMARSAPLDREDVRQNVKVLVSAAAAFGNPELSKAVNNSNALAEFRIDASELKGSFGAMRDARATVAQNKKSAASGMAGLGAIGAAVGAAVTAAAKPKPLSRTQQQEIDLGAGGASLEIDTSALEKAALERQKRQQKEVDAFVASASAGGEGGGVKGVEVKDGVVRVFFNDGSYRGTRLKET